MVFWGGGHVDYQGNELYSLTVTGTPTLTRLTDPSVFDLSNMPDALPSDGAPSARHTYQDWVYYPVGDKYLSFGGSLASGSCAQTQWQFDPVTNTWSQLSPNPTLASFGGPSTDCTRMAYDPNTNKFLMEYGGAQTLFSFDPVANSGQGSWARLTANSSFCTGITNCNGGMGINGVIDPVRKKWFFFGSSSETPGAGSLVQMYVDISTGSSYASNDLTGSTTGCSPLNVPFPGLVYDPARGVIVGYPGTGNSVITFNPTTGQCVTQTFSSGPPTSPHGYYTGNGINGRFAFFPAIGKYVIATAIDVDAFTLALDHDPTYGLGKSTLTCLDRDGDGYGVGPVQMGPFTDLAVDATTNTIVTSASYTFTTNDLYRHIFITGGSGWVTGEYAITAIASGAATLQASPGTTGLTGGQFNAGGCLGPDADDLDATVWTSTQAIAKWGSINGWLNHLGYNVTHYVYYLSPTGNDSTGTHDNPALPYATWTGGGTSSLNSLVTAGDAVIMRNGWNGSITPPPTGYPHTATAGNPIFIMSYPGEVADLYTGSGISALDVPNLVVDGIRTIGTGVTGGTSDQMSTSTSAHRIIRHMEGVQDEGGLATLNAFNGLWDWVIEDNLWHDDTAQHCLYIGVRNTAYPNNGVFVRRNICYNASWNGLHLNGRFVNLVVEQNLIYNTGIASISMQEGVSNSYIKGNVAFNGNEMIEVDSYPGKTGAMSCGPSGTALCSCPGSATYPGPATQNDICPYNQTGNLYENNTFYNTGMLPCANATCTASESIPNAVVAEFANLTNGDVAVDLGHNTFRNNVMVNYGNNNLGTPLHFSDSGSTSACSGQASTNTTCLGWVATDTLTNNMFYQADSHHAAGVLSLGANIYNCSQATSYLLANTGCLDGNPGFVAADPSYWDTLPSFNFQLTGSSIALNAGVPGTTIFDEIGSTFVAAAPSIGALTPALGSGGGSGGGSACDLNSDGVVNVVDVQIAINQAIGIALCTNADLQGNGTCNVIDVQRVINASIGGSCVTGP